ncbi:MAG TPA: heparan-alpha-glucosaminide N-acetyltransferase domain-containing protein [Candidatus Didemnitutus sp.]|nr:heparan-alpha-glucosaminide N-acetyltransferase domain-containing protein [Candidatus Didemnitutus sp.]
MATNPITKPAAPRLESIDLLRGVIMVVMALDHVRDFFQWSAVHGYDPLDLATTTPALFFTRWITNYCAPLFSFLAGTGTYLAFKRGKSKRELSWFLVTRGLWLIFLELTLLTWFGWQFQITPTSYILATLWTLGWAMIVLAGLIHLPLWATAVISIGMIVGHNALDRISPASWGGAAPVWELLHAGGNLSLGKFSFWVFYPLIPWPGIMGAGFCLGAVYAWPSPERRRWLYRVGAIAVVAFVVLRGFNIYGNTTPWMSQKSPLFSFLSFLDCRKYPPSLLYFLMTVGPGLLFLGYFEGRAVPGWMRPFLVYGRVPMFYYLLHIPLIHGLSKLLNVIRYGGGDFNAISSSGTPPPDAGISLGLTWLVWIGIVAALYLPCRWFADLKRRRKDAWLTYF